MTPPPSDLPRLTRLASPCPARAVAAAAAELVASLCDLGVFICGIILIAKPHWSSSERETMGLAMLSLQAIGFLVFISVRVLLAGRTIVLTTAPLFGCGLCGPRRRRSGAPQH